jgi:hypothetical protein
MIGISGLTNCPGWGYIESRQVAGSSFLYFVQLVWNRKPAARVLQIKKIMDGVSF